MDTTGASSTARQPPTVLSPTAMARASTMADLISPINKRRSSFMTAESADRASIKSSIDDFAPRTPRSNIRVKDESSALHSAPLALALLPAVAGLFFHNGSAIITDVILLGLAAIFLNWSVRVPWEWYLSTQALQIEDSMSTEEFVANDIIPEEDGSEAHDDTTAAEAKAAPNQESPKRTATQQKASSELRVYEVLALLTCFLSPIFGAWVLHGIRSQLSRPSEGLVSNYNLTIFLLGSELRPLSHLIKLIQSRTLYLQRVLASNPYVGESISTEKVTDLAKRLDELERHIAENSISSSSQMTPTSPTATSGQVSTEVRKGLQPELDALNRAVRRYEKRTTMLTMQTESRLQDLEARMADAITLAAAAERGHSISQRGSATILFNWICAVFVMPAKAIWTLVILPGRTFSAMIAATERVLTRDGKDTPIRGAKTVRIGRVPSRGGKKLS